MMYTDDFMNNRIVRNDKATVDKLVEDNIKLVYWVYIHKIQKSAAIRRNEEDILAIGNIALWEAATSFDTTRLTAAGTPVKFATLAVRQIYFRMVMYIQRFINKTPEPISLSMTVDTDGDIQLLDVIPDPTTIVRDTDIDAGIELEMFNDFLNAKLIPAAAIAILQKTVLDDETYVNVAKQYGVSRQRIEQLRSKALRAYITWREKHYSEYFYSERRTQNDVINKDDYEKCTVIKLAQLLNVVTDSLYGAIARGPSKNMRTKLLSIGKEIVIIQSFAGRKSNFEIYVRDGTASCTCYLYRADTYIMNWKITE